MKAETQEERFARFDAAKALIVEQLKALRPDAEVVKSKYSTDLVYYSASVIKSEVVITKNTRTININSDANKLVRSGFLTKKEAEEAIAEVMPEAKAKFKKCLDAYRQLTQDMGFYRGFNYDGDTHGIYNEYNYISFKIGEFDFQFAIND